MSEVINILNNFFPTDISKLILRISDKSEHQEKFVKCLEKIEFQSYMILYKTITHHCKRWNNQYNKILITKYILDPDKVLSTLHNCNCCHRHQTRKPESIENHQDFHVLNHVKHIQINTNDSYKCKCKCRRFARLIVRCYMFSDNDLITQERYFAHSLIMTNLGLLSTMSRNIELSISGIDNRNPNFSHLYDSYSVIMLSYSNRIRMLINELMMHITELPEVSIVEDFAINELYISRLNESMILHDYLSMNNDINIYNEMIHENEYLHGYDYPEDEDNMSDSEYETSYDYSDDSMS
jgi:hypothetical protein